MNNSQLAAFKAAILAETDPAFVALRNANSTGAMAAWYNETATPTFTVWKTDVDVDDFKAAMVWSEVAGLTTIKASVLTLILAGSRVVVSSQNIRDAFAAIFNAGTTLTNLAALAKRPVNRVERVFATGTGSNGSPGTLVFDGTVSNQDVIDALAS